MPLSAGATDLPTFHLSARVPWHDMDWTGRICEAPAANHSCTVLRNIKGNKDADDEEQRAGEQWPQQGSQDDYPPCVFERAGFMRTTAQTVTRAHAYARPGSSSHGHFEPTAQRMPPYSLEAVPYRWTLREEAPKIAAQWDIGLEQGIEDAADELMDWSSGSSAWLQDHRNQLAMLDTFFSAIDPGGSLVLIYAKDVPLLEDRPPGARILVGAGRVTEVSPHQEWEYSGEPEDWPLRSVLWERAVHHSIRPDFTDGFLLPYQQLLRDPELAGEDLSPFVAHAPSDHFDEFSYVSELVGNDAAVGALLELARVVDLLPGVASGPWDQVATWLSDRLADTWQMRGPYPGLGSALTAAGIERGAIVAHRVVETIDGRSEDTWAAVDAAIGDAADGTGPAAGLIGRMARRAWERLSADEERRQVLRILSRFPLTTAQARRLFDREDPRRAGVSDDELLRNPYLLYELDRGYMDSVGLRTIDRGLFPRDADARAVLDRDPLPEPVSESHDDRRVRGACTYLLERAADQGHTLLDEPGLRRRLSALDINPPCDPATGIWEIAATDFHPTLHETPLANERERGWQLSRLAAASELITQEVETRIEQGPHDVEWDWRTVIDDAIEEPQDPDDNDEEVARIEKARALGILARSRIAALVGPAGTGKTTMLRALCTQPEIESGNVLLVAPTGKARVQLGESVGTRALTLAQFLRKYQRWDYETGYRINPEAPRTSGYSTIVVDEASMLTEEMLAALIDAVDGVSRIVLCGDHRQLPPIGAGRPFADLVRHLEPSPPHLSARSSGGGLAELTVSRRQRRTETSPKTDVGRDDLAVASMFSVDGSSPAADEALARVLSGGGDGTLRIIPWTDEEDLHEKVCTYLTDEMRIERGNSDSLRASLGATGDYQGRPSFPFGEGGQGAENWQLLSPVRSRNGGVEGLNRLVRRTWRAGDTHAALKAWKLPPPMGADEVLFFDKVMCVANHRRNAWHVSDREVVPGDVANGEVGMAVHWPTQKNKKPGGLKIEFSTQPGVQYTFWSSQLNAESEHGDVLELAYAVTIHKAQGSQFDTTLVVVPNPCPLLSPELLYTALTRQRYDAVLFVQGDPAELRQLGQPSRSETARRLTRLFRLPDPFESPEGITFDGSHIHRTANGEMVRSKSEVIVADTLKRLEVPYVYEQPLRMPDGTERLPDFTLRVTGRPPIYWEHLGMLNLSGYRADWEAKKGWYADHGVLPWHEGGGERGVLAWSEEATDDPGIDSRRIEALVHEVVGTAPG